MIICTENSGKCYNKSYSSFHLPVFTPFSDILPHFCVVLQFNDKGSKFACYVWSSERLLDLPNGQGGRCVCSKTHIKKSNTGLQNGFSETCNRSSFYHRMRAKPSGVNCYLYDPQTKSIEVVTGTFGGNGDG